MATRFNNPFDQYFDDAGNPLINGKMYFYKAGTNTPQNTYKDINQSVANTNPVILTAAGRLPAVFLQELSYDIILTDGDGVQIEKKSAVGGEVEQGNFSAWNNLISYSMNDIVQGSDNKFYISLTNGNLNSDPVSTPATWTRFLLTRVWNPNETYATGMVAQGSNGKIYVSLTDGNVNNDPVSDIANWQVSSDLDVPNVILAAGRMYAYNNF